MKKGCVLLLVVCSIFLVSQAWADPWALVVNYQGNPTAGLNPGDPDVEHPGTIHLINLAPHPPTVLGPFLEDQLYLPPDPIPPEGSSGGGLLDTVAVAIPGSAYALVSDFGDSLIFKINLEDPRNPILEGSLDIGMLAEDIAVTGDGSLALVTDGNFATNVAMIDLATFTLNALAPLEVDHDGDPLTAPVAASAQAVAVTPNGRTVLFADYVNGKIHYGLINAAKDGIESLQSVTLCSEPLVDNDMDPSTPPVCQAYRGWPLNIAISPNGATAIVAASFCGSVWVLRITGAGAVEPGNPFFLEGLPSGYVDDPVGDPSTCHRIGEGGVQLAAGGNQSIAFSPDGSRAYVTSQVPDDYDGETLISFNPDQLSVLNITGPGEVSIGTAGAADLLSNIIGQFFGVDTLAITPDGRYALVGNANIFGEENEDLGIPGVSRNVSLVDLQTFEVAALETDSSFPVGITIFSLSEAIPIPVMAPWGMVAFVLMVSLIAFYYLRRRQSAH